MDPEGRGGGIAHAVVGGGGAPGRLRGLLVVMLGIAVSLFTVFEVNFGILPPLSQVAVFGMLGVTLCFLIYPTREKWKGHWSCQALDYLLAAATVGCFAYLLWQGQELTNARAGRYTPMDHAVAVAATLLILEATRRAVGWALPILALVFLIYAKFGSRLPDWFLPHRGYPVKRIAAQCFLGSEGILGVALRVMFTYVYLFVVFGAFLEMSGATQFIIDFARKLFGRSSGGPAKVAVLGSGLMGSLSGSAVANAVTTGTFTIPMMRSAGFQPHIAAGITAAAASGGALMPPVMGAGAYMMLEIIDPPVKGFLQIAKAALIPAILYYLSILLIVHFYARRTGAAAHAHPVESRGPLPRFEGLVFFAALGALIAFLVIGKTAFRAVTYSLEVILLLSIWSPRLAMAKRTRLSALTFFIVLTGGVAVWLTRREEVGWMEWTTWADAAIPGMLMLFVAGLAHAIWRPILLEAFQKAARSGITLVAASACVGIIIAVVTLTGLGTAFPNKIVPLAKESLLLALMAIMFCSILLGMGLPSAVCYLLMATLIGPVLNKLGVIPLAAHMFIFYFGMMSMVTPPVALAAYASASIAGSDIMRSSMAAFRFSLVGFTLPFMFVYRPELLLLNDAGADLGWAQAPALLLSATAAILGIVSLAAAIAGFFRSPLALWHRGLMFAAAALLLLPHIRFRGEDVGLWVNGIGTLLFVVAGLANWMTGPAMATFETKE